MRRWLLVILLVAVLAMMAGFFTFGGADMGAMGR